MIIELKLEIPEAKSREQLMKLTRDLLYAGGQCGLIDYKIVDLKIKKE